MFSICHQHICHNCKFFKIQLSESDKNEAIGIFRGHASVALVSRKFNTRKLTYSLNSLNMSRCAPSNLKAYPVLIIQSIFIGKNVFKSGTRE